MDYDLNSQLPVALHLQNGTQTLCRLYRQQVQGAANLHGISVQKGTFNQIKSFSYQNYKF